MGALPLFNENEPAGRILAGLFLFLSLQSLYAHSDHNKPENEPPQILAPGYQSLNFDAPLPGTYELPVIGTAGNGKVLDENGHEKQLGDFFGDKYVVLSFIYTHCDDINGCPLATYVSSQVQNKLLSQPSTAKQVRFISMSFDPVNDTPGVMKKYGENFVKDGFDWNFLTTTSEKALSPILSDYNQSILKDVNEEGEEVGTISHILRVYLIDKDKHIRNIYSTSFLHPDTVLNDIRTLILSSNESDNKETGLVKKPGFHGAGDNKNGYESSAYVTETLSLNSRKGTKVDLLSLSDNVPAGLPEFSLRQKYSLSREKIELGRKLFYDRRLSHNDTFSCAMCHIPEQGFGSHELATAVGIEGRTVRRNAPTLFNIAYAELLFHDARETNLSRQIWEPLLAENEMGNPSVGHVIDKIATLPDYRGMFEKSFAGESVNMLNLGKALASYQRVLISANSRFDKWYFRNDRNSMSDAEKNGFRLFSGKARCTSCHNIKEDYALFTDHKLHNTGVGYKNSMSPDVKAQRVLVAPGVWLDVETESFKDASEKKPNDLGYYEISGDPDDRWKYKTPGLRNIALTAPYMHDGSLSTLRDVVEFYNRGGIENELLDPLLGPLNLDDKEISEIVSFLESLTGDNIDLLISDAFAAPVGNRQ